MNVALVAPACHCAAHGRGTLKNTFEHEKREMDVKRIYFEDLQIAQALIHRDERVTRNYFYRKCYPLFKSIYNSYYTDCAGCKEFMDEIYIIVLAPDRKTGKCQMENFRGESTLASWLKTACLYYCYRKYELKNRMPRYERLIPGNDREKEIDRDRDEEKYGSVEINFNHLNREDALVILKQMPNKRYSEIIRLRYLELLTHEETAKALGMTMENYYNKHKLAKAQYVRIHGKEEQR